MKLAVFASGGGSNLKRILEACQSGELAAEVGLVVCNRPGSRCIQIAIAAGVPVLVTSHEEYPSRVAHERVIAAELSRHAVDLVVLAGYMRLISPFLLGYMFDPMLGQSRILNIHPADTARYQGTDGYGWAIATGATETAITVHYVDEGMDTGAVILRAPVPIEPGDTLERLKARGLAVEHHVYPQGIQRVLACIEESSKCAAS